MQPENNQPRIPDPVRVHYVPWSIFDTWLAVGLLVVLSIGLLVLVASAQWQSVFESAGIFIAELVYLLPVALILGWRRISWRHLGFGKFDAATMGIGCGLLIAGYFIILLHNLALIALGVETQGEEIFEIFSRLNSQVWFILVGVVSAPFAEEIFFRGFLFQGFRRRYGWVAGILISSAVFAAAHLDPVAFIPTFVLGAVLAYVYHRSNSVWPGILLHFSVNALAMCAALAATRLPNIIPS